MDFFQTNNYGLLTLCEFANLLISLIDMLLFKNLAVK